MVVLVIVPKVGEDDGGLREFLDIFHLLEFSMNVKHHGLFVLLLLNPRRDSEFSFHEQPVLQAAPWTGTGQHPLEQEL